MVHKHTHILALVVLFVGLPVPVMAVALNTLTTGFQIGATQTKIDAYGVCHNVQATDGKTYFVPTNTAGEWSAFRTNKPAGVSLHNCRGPYLGWKTDTHNEDWLFTVYIFGGVIIIVTTLVFTGLQYQILPID